MTNTVYLSLGSNINPADNLEAAVNKLVILTRLLAISSVWETKPIGLTDQPNFLNAAAIVETELSAELLKRRVIDNIEQSLGRVRQANKNAPRPIDIDIMLFNQQIFKLGHRRIPDPEILERSFVAIPLAEIAPNYQHPETGQTLRKIAQSFQANPKDIYLRQDVTQTLRQVNMCYAPTIKAGATRIG
jgi:2-amino-4-hydroxy-6-hydroxymethyldihydropteridine diphosphokinase